MRVSSCGICSVNGREFPAVSVVTGRGFPAVTFLEWGIVKNSVGRGKNVQVLTAGLSILGNGILS